MLSAIVVHSRLLFVCLHFCENFNQVFLISSQLIMQRSFKGRVLKTHVGHMWQSISLIASNAAALLPAYWALRHKVILANPVTS